MPGIVIQGEGCGQESAFQWCRWWGEGIKCRECRCHSLAEGDDTTSEFTEPEPGSHGICQNFDLSHNAVLRSLEVQAPSSIREPFRILEALLPPHLLYPPRSMSYPSPDECVGRHRTWPGYCVSVLNQGVSSGVSIRRQWRKSEMRTSKP